MERHVRELSKRCREEVLTVEEQKKEGTSSSTFESPSFHPQTVTLLVLRLLEPVPHSSFLSTKRSTLHIILYPILTSSLVDAAFLASSSFRRLSSSSAFFPLPSMDPSTYDRDGKTASSPRSPR